MARMHTRKKGKSGSKRVYSDESKSWVQLNSEEIENLIVQFRKEGSSSSVIGVRLRDQYGIPGTKTILNRKIGDVLKEKSLSPEVPEDLMNLINRYKNVTRHMKLNRNDMSNKRGQQLIMAKILRMTKYYKSKGYLSREWNLNKVI
ncbi:MAG: 30S ribosomal protein S15 [Thermoplasmataceae archaeon]